MCGRWLALLLECGGDGGVFVEEEVVGAATFSAD